MLQHRRNYCLLQIINLGMYNLLFQQRVLLMSKEQMGRAIN